MLSPANAEEVITSRVESRSSFSDDTIFQNIEFTGPTDHNQLYGGALDVRSGSLTFDKTATFTGNKISYDTSEKLAALGGAVYALDATFTGDASFLGNAIEINRISGTAGVDVLGGALYSGTVSFGAKATFKNNSITFTDTTAVYSGNGIAGGALAADTVKITGEADFENNFVKMTQGYGFGGAAIFSNGNFGGTTTFKGNRMIMDKADGGGGGAFYIQSGSNVTFAGATTTFDANYVKSTDTGLAVGGAFALFGGNATFENTATFTGNYIETDGNGEAYGGAVQMESNSVLTFDGDTTFQGNYVKKADVRQSNSIYADSSTINITAGSGKTFADYDGMDGKDYSVKITGAANVKLFGGVRGTNVTFDKSGAGTLTLQADSSLAKNANGVWDKAALDVTNLTISAGNLAFTTSGTLTVGSELLMIRSENAMDIAALGIADGDELTVGNYKFTYTVTANELSLTVTQGDDPSNPSNPSDPADPSNPSNPSDPSNPTPTPVSGQDQYYPSVYGVRAAAKSVRNTILARANGGFVQGGYKAKGKSGGDEADQYGLWAQGVAGDFHRKGAYNGDVYGFVAGFDGKVSDALTLGVGYGYTYTSESSDGVRTKTRMHNGFVYGRYQPSDWFADATAGYGFGDSEIKDGDSYDTQYADASVTLGRDFTTSIGVITPAASLRYTFVKTDDYTADGVSYASKDSDILTGAAGLRWSDAFGAFKPYVSAAATYDFISDGVKVTAVSGGVETVLRGDRTKRLGAEFGAGVSAEITDDVSVTADWRGNFTTHYRDNTASLAVRIDF